MTLPLTVSAPEGWTSQIRAHAGALVSIRPLRPDDRELEIAFINSLSERSRYFRLFTPLKFLSRHLLDQLMDIDYRRRMAFVATTQCDGNERIIGVARYGAFDESGAAEFAVSVTDAWQRRGIARLLSEELMRYARTQGIVRLVGLVLPDNQAMIALARRLAFSASYDPSQHLVHISRELVDVPLEPEHTLPSTGLVAADGGAAEHSCERGN
jgi:acetyltransferase